MKLDAAFTMAGINNGSKIPNTMLLQFRPYKLNFLEIMYNMHL